jgi:hypothetical protein
MVFLFGVEFPLIEFLFFLAILNLVDIAVIFYLVLKLRDDIKKMTERIAPRRI